MKDDLGVYTGWRLYDEVILIEQVERSNGNIKKVYIADAKDKRQIASGHKWADYTEYDYKTKQTREIVAKEYKFKNEGFTLELSDSPSTSWQGGKLSFCMCIIKKDGHTWKTGIASDLLINLLKQTTCINGEVQGNICFARNNGRVGMVAVGTESYRDAVKDFKIRKSVAKSSKVPMGYTHKSLTKSNIYMFDFYNWAVIEEAEAIRKSEYGYYWNRMNMIIPVLTISDKPVLKKMYIDTDVFRFYIKDEDTQRILKTCKTTGEATIEFTKALCRTDRSIYMDSIVFRSKDQLLGHNSIPQRTIGEKIFDASITDAQYIEMLKVLAEYCAQIEPNLYSKKSSNRFNVGILEFVLGTSLAHGNKPGELHKVADKVVEDWVYNIGGHIIVKYNGKVYMTKNLKEELSDGTITSLQYK